MAHLHPQAGNTHKASKRGMRVSIPTASPSHCSPTSSNNFTLPLLHSHPSSTSSPTPPSVSSPPSARRRPRPVSAYVRHSISSPALPSSSSHHAFTIAASPDDSPPSPSSSPSPPPPPHFPLSRRHSLTLSSPSSSPPPPPLPSWPGTSQLRRLFRYFDRNGDGLISLAELRAGLYSLGFDTSSYTSLLRFSGELKADSEGLIKESSFVRAFRKLNREKIVEELRRGREEEEMEGEDMKIVMVDIGEEERKQSDNSQPGEANGEESVLQPEEMLPVGRYAEYSFKPSQLSSYLLPTTPQPLGACPPSPSASASPSSLWRNRVQWLDIIGLHTPTLSFLSNHFSLPPSTFDPALIGLDSVGRVEYDHDAVGDCGVMSVLMHACSMDVLPYRKRTVKEKEEWKKSHSRHSHSHMSEEWRLVSDRVYRHKRPSLTSLPIHIIIVGSHTVITIHPLTSTPELDDIFSEFRSMLSQSILHSLPFSTSSSSSLIGMRLSTAKTLAIELMDEIVDWNWSLRDILKQWKILVSETLADGWVSPDLLEHIHDLENISLRAGRLISPQARMLQELVEEEGVNKSDDSQPSQSASQVGGEGRQRLVRERGHGTIDSLSKSFGNLKDLFKQRSSFLSEVSLDLRNLSKSVNRLSDQLKLTNDLSQPLLSYYKQRKDEETNKILYLLTVVTTIVTPLQLTSGIYGMNFEYLPGKLQYTTTYETIDAHIISLLPVIFCLSFVFCCVLLEIYWRYSYAVFWGVNLLIIALIAVFFRKKKWL